MDGNGRWAATRNRPRIYGHGKGAESVREVVEAAGELGIEALTLYAFSEENWSRPLVEVMGIMKLLDRYVRGERENLAKNNVRFRVIGSLDRIPAATRRAVLETEEYLASQTGLVLNVALSYGGRSEIVEAARKLAYQVSAGSLKPSDITPDLFGESLMTSGLPDPDLIIRTSGEQRISNFLLWQIAYSELYFSPVHWPDFKKTHFFEAIEDFQGRSRRFGGVAADSSGRTSVPGAGAVMAAFSHGEEGRC
jgi:undecaprenyl diphosphate synthase